MDYKNTLLQLLGQGSARDAGNDLALRDEWNALKEEEALGNIPPLPEYSVWKQTRLRTQEPERLIPVSYK